MRGDNFSMGNSGTFGDKFAHFSIKTYVPGYSLEVRRL